MNIAQHHIIIRPVLTEKATQEGLYTFIVHKDADKLRIRRAVEELFSVKVSRVNILNYKPLIKNFGRRKGVVKGFKKAYISLVEGTIDFNNL